MNISFWYDHGVYSIKDAMVESLISLGHTVTSYWPDADVSVDYPDFAHPVAGDILSGKSDRGILMCGTWNGMAMTANKHPGIRAWLAWSPEIARLMRFHNDAQILCLPARFLSVPDILECIRVFLSTEFEGGRHCARIEKIKVIRDEM